MTCNFYWVNLLTLQYYHPKFMMEYKTNLETITISLTNIVIMYVISNNEVKSSFILVSLKRKKMNICLRGCGEPKILMDIIIVYITRKTLIENS